MGRVQHQMTITFHRWVRIPYVEDYLRLGWVVLPTLAGTGHGLWAVHMVWGCQCGCVMREPVSVR